MIDTSATYNYLASTEVEPLRMILEKGTGRVKPINSSVHPVAGVVKGIPIEAGCY